ncbi:MAG TPA: hypothetical protein DHW82_08555 [Spirochaetia bacterium]|nr:MAG: hypothetical protein A2Y41_04920 [Spirochaetes bacterium GWB1_36_13]HCL57040.1 hypothetical protein [Spirochaetia bacterium]
MQIGQMLIQEGLITKEELNVGLALQRYKRKNQKLGEILIDIGYLTIKDFEQILFMQLQDIDLEKELEQV